MNIDRNTLVPVFIALGSMCIFLVIRFVILAILKRSIDRNEGYKILFRVIRFPSYFWCIIAGIGVGIEFWDIAERLLKIANLTIAALAIISITLATSKVLEEIVYHYLYRIRSPLARNRLIRIVIKLGTFLVGALILLSHFGVRIQALLTAFGVGGLAVGFALQDTLSNVFAGLGLLLDRAITVGSQITLEGGQNGKVEDIGWRTTRIRLESNDILIIPNTKLSQSIAIRKLTHEK